VVDIRPASAFASGFVPGTINIPAGKSFVGWAGWLLRYDQDFYLLSGADDDGAVRAALAELMMIGLDRCAGWFGPEVMEPGTLQAVPQLDVASARAQLAEGRAQVLDVRALDEFEAGHIDGAHHIPLGRLEARLGELPGGQPIVVQCQAGSRSAIAASLLMSRGVPFVSNLQGGINAWQSAGFPVVAEPTAVLHG
jgi:hydroxyacylglutathione hydrolase